MVTHDLKSPLSTILMATEMANASKDCTAEIEMISRQTTGMLKMVDDLLCSQAGKAGKLNLKVGCVAVREALSPVLATVATTMHKHGINIISDVADVTCLCDKDRLSQILINLISNSIKNTPSGGFIAIHAQLSGDAVLFMIEDSGGGIAREKLASIFTSYETDGKFGGHGLGLSIVKSLVEAHHGRVWAESVIGEGTKIFFTIPKHIEGA
jgi:signal transduction histidine kinase